MIQVAATAVHQACNQCFSRRPRARHGPAEGAGAVVQVDRFIAVIFNKAFHIVGDDVEGFIPADAFELALAAQANALHRVLQAIRVIDAAAHRATAQAGANLVQSFIVVVTGIIGLNIFDHAVDNVHTQRASAAAVDSTGAPDNFFITRTESFSGIRYTGERGGEGSAGKGQTA